MDDEIINNIVELSSCELSDQESLFESDSDNDPELNIDNHLRLVYQMKVI